jgi:membrane protease subunit (stomatin/prohibitin family)
MLLYFIIIFAIVHGIVLIIKKIRGKNQKTTGQNTPMQQTTSSQSPVTKQAEDTKFCSHCGTALSSDAKFCTKCGQAVK